MSGVLNFNSVAGQNLTTGGWTVTAGADPPGFDYSATTIDSGNSAMMVGAVFGQMDKPLDVGNYALSPGETVTATARVRAETGEQGGFRIATTDAGGDEAFHVSVDNQGNSAAFRLYMFNLSTSGGLENFTLDAEGAAATQGGATDFRLEARVDDNRRQGVLA